MRRPTLTIALLIRSGFAALVVLGLTISLLSAWREQAARERVSLLSDLSRQKNRLTVASLALDRLELAETNFRLFGGPPQKSEAMAALDAVRTALTDLRDTAQNDSTRHQTDSLQAQLAAHATQQAQFFQLSSATQSASDQLSSVGAALTNAGNELIASVDIDAPSENVTAVNIISRRLMQMQIVSLQFQNHRNADGATAFDNTARAVQTMIDSVRPSLSDSEDAIKPIEAQLSTYRSQFEVWSQSIRSTDKLYTEVLRPGLAALQESLRRMDADFTDQFRTAREEAAERSRHGIITGLIVGGVALLAGLALTTLITRRIIPPLAASTATMRLLAEGHHTTPIAHTDRQDEIGAMARMLEVFRANAQRAEALARAELATQEAQRARNARLEQQIGQFDQRIATAMDSLTKVAARMESTAGELAATAEQTTQQSHKVMRAAHDTSGSVQSVAGSTEQLAASIQEISRQVTQSTTVAQRAVDGARKTDQTVQELATGAQKIGEVVEMISSIAGQTNLLALNATIEAARAGDAGKGFAVVASEVKALATATARATEDIAAQITAIQTVTHNAVQEIGQIASVIAEINQIGTAIAAAVEEQGMATAMIARNVEQAAGSTDHVSHLIQEVREAADRTGRTASDMHNVSTEVAEQTKAMIGEIARFTTEVKAA